MATTYEQYTKELRKSLGYMPTWLPGVPVFLGDTGQLSDQLFNRVTHLEPLGIAFEPVLDRSSDSFEHQTSGEVSIETTAAGAPSTGFARIADAEAGVGINFGRENAVVLSLRDVRAHRVSDVSALERQIRERWDVWDDHWLVVTEVVTATSATILISGSYDSRVELRAKANVGVEGLELANAEAHFEVAYSKGMHTQIVAASGLTPLFRAIRVRVGIDFWGQERRGFELLP